jgi:hypothetical protein
MGLAEVVDLMGRCRALLTAVGPNLQLLEVLAVEIGAAKALLTVKRTCLSRMLRATYSLIRVTNTANLTTLPQSIRREYR